MTEILKSYCEKHYEIKKKLFIEIFHKMIIYKNVFFNNFISEKNIKILKKLFLYQQLKKMFGH